MYHTLLNWAIATEHYQASDVECTSNELYSTVLVECFSELLVKLLSHDGVMCSQDTPCRPVARGSWTSWLVSCLKPPKFEEDNKFYSGNSSLLSLTQLQPETLLFSYVRQNALTNFSVSKLYRGTLWTLIQRGDSLPDSSAARPAC